MLVILVGLPVVAGLALWARGDRPGLGLAVGTVASLAATLGAAVVAAAAEPSAALRWGSGITLRFEVVDLARAPIVLVAFVGLAVATYALGYGEDRGRARMVGLLVAFVGTMELLLVAADLLSLLVAWELVGVLSWGLIAHRWRGDAPGRAGQAFVATRAGDLGLFLAAGAAYAATGTFDMAALPGIQTGLLTVVAAGVVVAAVAKSAQLPFSPWLFAAMAGPTPASALLHSATMVAAGAYLLARLQPTLDAVAWFAPVTIGVGLTTAVAGGVVALAQPARQGAARGVDLGPLRPHVRGRRGGLPGGGHRPPRRPRGVQGPPVHLGRRRHRGLRHRGPGSDAPGAAPAARGRAHRRRDALAGRRAPPRCGLDQGAGGGGGRPRVGGDRSPGGRGGGTERPLRGPVPAPRLRAQRAHPRPIRTGERTRCWGHANDRWSRGRSGGGSAPDPALDVAPGDPPRRRRTTPRPRSGPRRHVRPGHRRCGARVGLDLMGRGAGAGRHLGSSARRGGVGGAGLARGRGPRPHRGRGPGSASTPGDAGPGPVVGPGRSVVRPRSPVPRPDRRPHPRPGPGPGAPR